MQNWGPSRGWHSSRRGRDGTISGVVGGQGVGDEAEQAGTMQVQVLEGFVVSGESLESFTQGITWLDL